MNGQDLLPGSLARNSCSKCSKWMDGWMLSNAEQGE
jgi:hypothetical protein